MFVRLDCSALNWANGARWSYHRFYFSPQKQSEFSRMRVHLRHMHHEHHMQRSVDRCWGFLERGSTNRSFRFYPRLFFFKTIFYVIFCFRGNDNDFSSINYCSVEYTGPFDCGTPKSVTLAAKKHANIPVNHWYSLKDVLQKQRLKRSVVTCGCVYGWHRFFKTCSYTKFKWDAHV